MIRISRSAVATRKLCPMKRYWEYHAPHPDVPEAGPVGIRPTGLVRAELSRGTLLHAMIEQGLRAQQQHSGHSEQTTPAMAAIEAVADDAMEGLELSRPEIAMIRRAAKGWFVFEYPRIAQEYLLLSTEEEWQWAMSPLITQNLRMDSLWKHRHNGTLMILDYKTMASMDVSWIMRMRLSEQTHLYIQALKERTQAHNIHMQYEAIVLGRTEDRGPGALPRGPLTNVYLTAHGEMTFDVRRSPAGAKGRHPIPVGVTDPEWLALVTREGVQDSIYATSGPLMIPAVHLLATKAATVMAEMRWADTIAQIEAAPSPEVRQLRVETLVERCSDACVKYGMARPCPYHELCWDQVAPDSDFAPRIDHHAAKETPDAHGHHG